MDQTISKNAVLNIDQAIMRIVAWIKRNGWAGWDPYDVKGLSFFRKIDALPNNLLGKLIKRILAITVDFNPLFFRKLFKVKPQINAKALGLFLSSYCNMYLATKDQQFLQKALEIASWLEQNRVTGLRGWGWGYSFDWQSVILIPEGTPSSIASVTVGEGFYLLYKCTGDSKYLTICKKICDFFVNELNLTYNHDQVICYSYTPLDDYQVHNTNLFIGEFLTRIGKELGDNCLIEQGLRCGGFALKEQQTEGFLPYWGLAQTEKYSNGKIHTDHYHSGFEIRALYGIWKNTGDARFQIAYNKYLVWYSQNLFENQIIPRFTSRSMYPIDIHACSEAILCRSVLLPDHPEQRKYLDKTVEWVIENMEDKEGEYLYLIKKLPLIGRYKIKIPMIRWGEAWMFRALSEMYRQINV
ncbi:MAG: hypothetical protein COS89_07870 [Deltaproteobacteria bacterium CG07_land_8_20_14_0_80_38_7]|nr:MAG: hypothetical protein COS89_07870 [Deltaproteobacteria bacterium CG07_land_8_20_14_0_80_38_7]